jgi:hypothetical protein
VRTQALAIGNNDIYVAGYIIDYITSASTPTIWKNNTATTLTSTNAKPEISNIAVINNDVYVTGGSVQDYKGGYWKNGNFNNLPGLQRPLFVTGQDNDVYIAGGTWVNQYPDRPLSPVYISVAAYQKNGVITKLSSDNTSSVVTALTIVK